MALPEAIQHGDWEQTRRLLSDPGYDVNETDNAGKTALLWSIELVKSKQDQYADITNQLLEHPLIEINKVCKPTQYDSSDRSKWEKYGGSALHWACRITATSSCGVEILLSDPGCDVNRKNLIGRQSALFFATQYTRHEDGVHAEIMRLLLQHPNCDVNARNKHKGTALHDACKFYMTSSVSAKLLLSDPRSNVSIRNDRGETALMLALQSSQNKDDVIKMFLERDNININVRDKQGLSALHYSAMGSHGHGQNIKTAIGTRILLADPRCDVNVLGRKRRTPVMAAFEHVQHKNDAYAHIIKSFLSHPRFDFNVQDTDGWGILHHACSYSAKSTVAAELLLADPRCNVNLQNRAKETALMLTAACTNESNHFLDIMRMLLKFEECDLKLQNAEGQTALHVILKHGIGIPTRIKRKVRTRTLEHHNVSTLFPLNYIESSLPVELLIYDPRYDVNIRDNVGDTPIMLAMRHLFEERHKISQKISLLLLNHADCDIMLRGENGRDALISFLALAKDLHGYTPACEVKEILTALIAKYDTEKADAEAFAIIVQNHSFDVCRQLLEKGADANSMSQANESALHRAVHLNSFMKCQLLLSYNADLMLRWGELTPCELAIAVGADPNILELLSEKLDWDKVEKYIENCSLVGESPVECSYRLGVRPWIQHFGEMASHLMEDHSVLKSLSNTEINISDPFGNTLSNPELVKIVQNCDQYFIRDCPERYDVINEILSLLKRVSKKIAESVDTKHLAYEPLLSGSTKEDTKCFYPNEIDIICELGNWQPFTKWLLKRKNRTTPTVYNVKIRRFDGDSVQVRKLCNEENLVEKAKLAVALNNAVVKALQDMIANGEDLGRIRLFKQPLVWRDKISMLQLLWKGTLFKNMVVHVDIVPSLVVPKKHIKPRELPLGVTCKEFYIIAQASRHFAGKHLESSQKLLERHTRFNVSYSREETTIMQALPNNIKRGYVTTKALRRADICCPRDLGLMGLNENIKTDDYITSYALKSCLFKLLKKTKKEDLDNTKDRYDWAEYIYQELEECLLGKKLELYNGKCLFDCSRCMVVRGCCMKVKLMLALTRTILHWLRDNRAALRENPDNGSAMRKDPAIGAALRHDTRNGAAFSNDPDKRVALRCDIDNGAAFPHDPDNEVTLRDDSDNGAALCYNSDNGPTLRYASDNKAMEGYDSDN